MAEKEGYRIENGESKRTTNHLKNNDMENKYYRIFLKFYPYTQIVRLRERERKREREGREREK